jgi:trimethylamine:corrinoid methyltransferase-like protein
MLGIGREGLRAGFLSLLTEDDVEQIHEAALRVLTRTGIIVHHEPVLTLLGRAGCRVLPEERRAYVPAPVIEQAVAQSPSHAYVQWSDRVRRSG